MCLYAFVSFFTSISWPPWSTRCPGTSRFINKTSHGSTGVLARHGLEFCRHGWQKMSREFQRINGALAIKCGESPWTTDFGSLQACLAVKQSIYFRLCSSRHVQLCLHDISWLGQIEWDKIWDQTSPCEWMHECSLIRRLMPTSGYPIMCTWHLLVAHRMNRHMAFIFHAFPMGGCRNGLTSRGTCPTTLPSLTKRAYAGQRVQHSARMAFTGRRHKLNWCFLAFGDWFRREDLK